MPFPAKLSRIFRAAALILILLHAALLVLNWDNYPTELDTPFHLLMGKMFADKGGIALWDSYEFAPMGRPNLYPPLLHILLWFLRASLRISFMDIGRLMAVAQAILALFCVWFFARKFFDDICAFFALVFFSSQINTWWWQTSVSPAALVTLLFLPFLYLFTRQKVWPCLAILCAGLYLHYGLSLAMALTVLLASLNTREYRQRHLKNALFITGMALALFAPWLIHVWRFRQYLFQHIPNLPVPAFSSFSPPILEIIVNANPVLWVFLIVGIIDLSKRLNEDFKYTLLFSGFVCFLFYIFIFSGYRFHTLSPIVYGLIAGYGASLALEKARAFKVARQRLYAAGLLASVVAFSALFEFRYVPAAYFRNLHRNLYLQKQGVILLATPLLEEVKAVVSGRPLEKTGISPFFQLRTMNRLLEFIRDNVPQDAILHINIGSHADHITLETGRRTDSGMFWEILTPELVDTVYALRTKGYFISRIRDFDNLLPEQLIKEGRIPKIIRQIDDVYIGYL